MIKLLYIFLIPFYLIAYTCQAQAYANFPYDSTYEIFSKKGKKGIRNGQGSIILDAKYQAFGWSDDERRDLAERLGYKQNDRWGLMTTDFEQISKAKYNLLIPLNEDLFIVSEKSKFSKVLFYGILKKNGRLKIKTKYRNIIPAGDFLITATKSEQDIYFGVITSSDKTVIPFEYYYINYLGHNNFFLNHGNGRKELVKLTPKLKVLHENIDSVSTFKDGVAIIFKNGKQGLIRQDGKLLLPIEYKRIEWNNGQHIYVTPLDKWAVINEKGREIGTHRADSIFYLNDSLLVKNTSSFAQVKNVYTQKDKQIFKADVKDVFGGNYILQNQDQIYIAQDSNKLISEKFSENVQWNDQFFVAKKKTYGGSEYMIINNNGKSILADSFKVEDQIIYLKIKSYWGVFSHNLAEIIPPLYQNIKKNGEQYIVNFKGRVGVIDEQNDWIIPPQYLSAEHIGKHYYKLVDKYLGEYISNGSEKIEAELYFDFYGQFGVEQNAANEYRLIDQQGNALTRFRPGTYNGHGEQGILFKDGKKHRLHDLEGTELFNIDKYDSVVFSDDEFLAIKKNGQWGFINQEGILRIANRYDTARPFREGKSAIKIRNSWGFINRQEELIVQPYYSKVSDFQNNTAFVKSNKKYGLINEVGDFIIEAEYDEIIKDKGFYLLRKSSKWGIARSDGKVITYPTYDKITAADNFLKVEKYGSIRILTTEGNDLINQQLDNIYYDDERKIFLAKTKSSREQVFLTDILSGKYP